jgi:hypothetical protein
LSNSKSTQPRPIKVMDQIPISSNRADEKALEASEVETKVILMGHPGLSCHVPVVRLIFILLIPKYHLEIFVRFTLLRMYYHLINFLIITL